MNQSNKTVNPTCNTTTMSKVLFAALVVVTLLWCSFAVAIAPSAAKKEFANQDAIVTEHKLRNAGYYDDIDDFDYEMNPDDFNAAAKHANAFLRANRGDR